MKLKRLLLAATLLACSAAGCGRYGFDIWQLPDGGDHWDGSGQDGGDPDGEDPDGEDTGGDNPGPSCTSDADCDPCAACQSGHCRARNPVARFSTGYNHACAVDSAARLWCWGSNSDGQLGTGELPQGFSTVPVQVEPGREFLSVSAGWRHTCAIDQGDNLFCWGDNSEGQLGVGDNDPRPTPTQVTTGRWSRVAASHGGGGGTGLHTCGIQTDGSLWCFGQNNSHQLGNGEDQPGISQNRPIRVGLRNDWQQISCGNDFSAAVDQDDTLWSWGENAEGALGIGNWSSQASPAEVTGVSQWTSLDLATHHGCGTNADGALHCWGADTFGEIGNGEVGNGSLDPDQVDLSGRFTDVGTALSHSCGLTDQGQIYCFGNNSSGQVGTGNTDSPVLIPHQLDGNQWIQLDSGGQSSCATTHSGTLWCWGRNSIGQLGTGDRDNRTTPEAICLQ